MSAAAGPDMITLDPQPSLCSGIAFAGDHPRGESAQNDPEEYRPTPKGFFLCANPLAPGQSRCSYCEEHNAITTIIANSKTDTALLDKTIREGTARTDVCCATLPTISDDGSTIVAPRGCDPSLPPNSRIDVLTTLPPMDTAFTAGDTIDLTQGHDKTFRDQAIWCGECARKWHLGCGELPSVVQLGPTIYLLCSACVRAGFVEIWSKRNTDLLAAIDLATIKLPNPFTAALSAAKAIVAKPPGPRPMIAPLIHVSGPVSAAAAVGAAAAATGPTTSSHVANMPGPITMNHLQQEQLICTTLTKAIADGVKYHREKQAPHWDRMRDATRQYIAIDAQGNQTIIPAYRVPTKDERHNAGYGVTFDAAFPTSATHFDSGISHSKTALARRTALFGEGKSAYHSRDLARLATSTLDERGTPDFLPSPDGVCRWCMSFVVILIRHILFTERSIFSTFVVLFACLHDIIKALIEDNRTDDDLIVKIYIALCDEIVDRAATSNPVTPEDLANNSAVLISRIVNDMAIKQMEETARRILEFNSGGGSARNVSRDPHTSPSKKLKTASHGDNGLPGKGLAYKPLQNGMVEMSNGTHRPLVGAAANFTSGGCSNCGTKSHKAGGCPVTPFRVDCYNCWTIRNAHASHKGHECPHKATDPPPSARR